MRDTVTRRRLLATTGCGAAGLALGDCALIRGGAQHPTVPGEQQQLAGTTLRLPAAALPAPGKVVEVQKPGGAHPDLLVMHGPEGYRVVTAHCTHRGCIVDWNAQANEWKCPCHGSRYAPDGKVLEGPARAPLVSPPAREENGDLVIELGGLPA
jgi:Rieske Fe-S protein